MKAVLILTHCSFAIHELKESSEALAGGERSGLSGDPAQLVCHDGTETYWGDESTFNFELEPVHLKLQLRHINPVKGASSWLRGWRWYSSTK